jgi:tetrahydromethanopterin S-methyltransferase subunit B
MAKKKTKKTDMIVPALPAAVSGQLVVDSDTAQKMRNGDDVVLVMLQRTKQRLKKLQSEKEAENARVVEELKKLKDALLSLAKTAAKRSFKPVTDNLVAAAKLLGHEQIEFDVNVAYHPHEGAVTDNNDDLFTVMVMASSVFRDPFRKTVFDVRGKLPLTPAMKKLRESIRKLAEQQKKIQAAREAIHRDLVNLPELRETMLACQAESRISASGDGELLAYIDKMEEVVNGQLRISALD